jgi:pimeloyl-ACP methyl ester carboxylesterase
MPEFTTDAGARLYYEMAGDGAGPALLFVHGWCSNVRHWDPQAEHFADHHRVLRVDRLGHGRSTVPVHYVFDFEQEADDIARVAASVGITEAVVIGHAAGIPTAIALAAGHPDLVRGLVCEDGVPQRPNPAQKATLAPMVEQLNGTDYGAGMKAVYPTFFHPDTDRALVDAVTAEAAQTPREVALAFLDAMPTLDTSTPASQLRIPVLFVMGEQSIVPTTVEALQETIKQAQLVAIPGTGHYVHLDAPAAFNHELDRFLASIV